MVIPAYQGESSPALLPIVHGAICRHATAQAAIASEYLNGLRDQFQERGQTFPTAGFPAGFLAELGAIGQIKLWEIEGFLPFTRPHVPTYAEAVADLRRRIEADPRQFASLQSAVLSQALLCFLIDHHGWEGQSILDADFLVGEIDEDDLVDAVAMLLAGLQRKGDGADKSLEPK